MPRSGRLCSCAESAKRQRVARGPGRRDPTGFVRFARVGRSGCGLNALKNLPSSRGSMGRALGIMLIEVSRTSACFSPAEHGWAVPSGGSSGGSGHGPPTAGREAGWSGHHKQMVCMKNPHPPTHAPLHTRPPTPASPPPPPPPKARTRARPPTTAPAFVLPTTSHTMNIYLIIPKPQYIYIYICIYILK